MANRVFLPYDRQDSLSQTNIRGAGMNTCRHLHKRGTAAVVGLLLAVTASWASAQTTRAASQPRVTQGQTSGAGSEEMHRVMKGGMDKMGQMPMTGDVDKDFAMMMKMHHQQAIDMARVEVQNGRSAQMKALANKIIKDQQAEIRQIDQFLQQRK